MVQEKKMESKLGPLDVIMYAAILCVHYPLRIALASYRLIKATIVKAASIPRQIIGYAIFLLAAIFESSEKKIVEVLNVLTSLPSYLFKKLKQFTNLSGNNSEAQSKEEKDLTNYTEILSSFVKKTSDAIYGLLVAYANFWRLVVLLPLKLSLLPLKTAKNVLATLINLRPEHKSEMDSLDQQSVTSHVINYFIVVMANLQYYLIYAIAIIERLMSQLSSLIVSTPRHLLSVIKIVYQRFLQIVALTVIFIYNVGRYSFFYVFIMVSKALSRPARKNSDQSALVQENLALKEELARNKINEHHKYVQQIKDLESELNEAQVAFDEERQEYVREIDDLKKFKQGDVEKTNDFNNERTKLQSEIHKLQAVIAEVRKENEEESRIKKQEAINLDNERNQLQERIQTLQSQVVILKKQNEAMASSYSESAQEMAVSFGKEREDLLQEIDQLQKRMKEMENAQNEDKHLQFLGKNGITAIQNCILHQQEDGNSLSLLEDLCNVCRRIEKEMVNFTEACQNLSNLHHRQNTIDEMKKVLVELADGVVPQIEVQQISPEEESSENEFRDQIQAQLNEIVQKGLENYETLDARSKAIDINMIVVKNQIEKIQETLHGMKAHLDVRDDKLDRLRNCHTRAVKVLREEKSKVTTLRDQIEKMEKAIKEIEDDKLMLSVTSAEKDEKINSLERENAELTQKLHDLRAQLQAQESEHTHDEKLHKAVVLELEREIQNLQNENDEKTRAFDQQLKEIQSEKLHERDEMVNRLRLHHERAMKELKDEKIQLSNLRVQIDSMEKAMREDQEEKLNYQTILSQSDLKISFLSRENSELKQKVSDLQSEMEEKEKIYQATQDNNDKLHQAVLNELQREMDDMENEHDQNVAKLAEKIQNLQSERVILLDQNMELQNLVEFLNKEVEKWKKAKKPFFGTK